jgi:hypothetical protein
LLLFPPYLHQIPTTPPWDIQHSYMFFLSSALRSPGWLVICDLWFCISVMFCIPVTTQAWDAVLPILPFIVRHSILHSQHKSICQNNALIHTIIFPNQIKIAQTSKPT